MAECDTYVDQYFECVLTQLPEAVAETSLEALCTSVDAWQRAATTRAGQEGLVNACATAYCAVAASCTWPIRDQLAMGCSVATGSCGWGDTGQKKVSDGYICDGDGEDPAAVYPIDCPAGTELVEGGACGGILGAGCCDANGDVWFCAEDGGAPMLFTESCQR